MILSLAKICVSLILMLSALAIVQKLGPRFAIYPEVQRKIIHTLLGLYSLSFPFLYSYTWEVALLCTICIIILISIRILPNLKSNIGAGIHNVDRNSLGEIFFALSIALLFHLSGDDKVFYILPMLILTLSDASAALVGTGYARSFFKVDTGEKSWEGTTFFFLTAWLLSMIVLLSLSDIPRESIVAAALTIALFGALIEAVSWRGLDNLFIPIGLFLLMQKLAFLPQWELATVSISFMCVLLLSTYIAKGRKYSAHILNTTITVAFFFWIVGGIYNLSGPLAVFAVFFYIQQKDKTINHLDFLFSMISTALFWYMISVILDFNTHYVYNISFALHLIMLVMLNNETRKIIPFIIAVLLAWLAINVRILYISDFDFRDFALSLSALALIFATGIAAAICYPLFEKNRWSKQTVATLTISSLGIPLALWL